MPTLKLVVTVEDDKAASVRCKEQSRGDVQMRTVFAADDSDLEKRVESRAGAEARR